jgi:hypothetical protein
MPEEIFAPALTRASPKFSRRHRNTFAVFRAVLACDRRVDAPEKINTPIQKIRARGLMLPAESSTFTKVLAV